MRRLAGLALAFALAGCVGLRASLPAAPVPYGSAIAIDAAPVPLDPTNPGRQRIGNFAYAGGVWLTSAQTSRLHGLSDLKVWPDGRIVLQGDQADLVEARLRLDGAGRLVGLTDGHISALKDEKGVDLYAGGQREFDTEGYAELANGDRLVSFEQHDRLMRYPKGAVLPVPAPFPQVRFIHNQSMESLAADPAAGPDAYRVGIEPTGEVFLCRLSGGCAPAGGVALRDGLGLVGLDILPGGRTAYLLRGFTVARGNFITLRIVDRGGVMIDQLDLARPLTVDNFEGVAATPLPGGKIRFYLVSDDNFGAFEGLPTDQRTLLLAFDWTPPT